MSDFRYDFCTKHNSTSVILPFDLESITTEWNQLRSKMIRFLPPEFSREEWSYLITFLEKCRLESVFTKTFGESGNVSNVINTIIRPKGNVALWLPNNVSLLGPLMLVMISLTGNSLTMKAGTRSENLTEIFLSYALKYLPDGTLRDYLKNFVTISLFSHTDSRNAEMSQAAKVRIFFGSDSGASYVDQLPHQLDCIPIYFTDRCSEAWIDKESITDKTVSDLIKVFNVYGQTGCTSPRKAVVVGGDAKDVFDLRERILSMWDSVISTKPMLHIASSNIMAKQLSSALGWDSKFTPNNSSVISVGEPDTEIPSSNLLLPLTWSTIDKAVKNLPSNIQTIGYSFSEVNLEKVIKVVGQLNIKRLVSLASMHHFGPIWDGYAYWRMLFEEIEVQS